MSSVYRGTDNRLLTERYISSKTDSLPWAFGSLVVTLRSEVEFGFRFGEVVSDDNALDQ